MKLSKETISFLKNFATISGNLLIKPGSVINTISASKAIYASIKVPETFGTQFGIYDLNEFLGVLSLFENPDIDFESERLATIKEGRSRIRYYSADESVLTVPSKAITLPPGDVAFTMTAEQINQITKTAGVIRAPDVIFKSVAGQGLVVSVGDKTNDSSNTYDIELGDSDETFQASIKVENLKLIPGNYNVEIVAKKALKFTSGDLMYVLSLEKDSTFDY